MQSGSNLDQLDAVRCSPLNLLQINSRLLDPPPCENEKLLGGKLTILGGNG